MGHSFCSGPSLPTTLNEGLSIPKQKTKHTPRSSGFTAERPLPSNDFTDSQNLHEIIDLLQKDPSSIARTNSKRRKRFVHIFAKRENLSSNQIKQLLHRRSSLQDTTIQSLAPLAKDVAARTTKCGRRYLQIATTSSMYECGNPSVYQVNHRPTVSGAEAPLRSLDNIDPYYFGIKEEYPHLIIDDGTGRKSQGAEAGKHSRSFLPLKPGRFSESFLDQNGPTTINLPIIKDVSGLADRNTSPVSKARIYGPQVDKSPPDCLTGKVRSSPLRPETLRPARPITPDYRLPETPRGSLEEPRKQFQSSPTANKYSKSPSIQSVTNSVADDAQSEASVGIVSVAQSAQFVHAGCYNNCAPRFPKPGPAPTGALPSLPEGSDSKTSIVYLPLVENSPRKSFQTSPKKKNPRSPGKRNRYRPLDNAVNEDTARLLRAQTESIPKHTSSTRSTEQAPRLGVDELKTTALAHKDEQRSSETPRESWQEIRAKSRKALKLRDLDRVRGQQDRRNWNAVELPLEEGEAAIIQSKAAMIRELSSSPAILPGQQPDHAVARTASLEENMDKTDSRTNSQLSPILVLAEQEPVQLPPNIMAARFNIQNATRPSQNEASKHIASSPIPSSESSHEDDAKKRTTLLGNPSSCNKQSTTRSNKSNPNRVSYSYPEAYPLELSDLESRLSARIAELEKKNAMLLNAFVAVMNTSAGLGGSEHFSLDGSGLTGGYRSSGLSGGSGLRSSGMSGVYGTSGAELERVEERYPNEMEHGRG